MNLKKENISIHEALASPDFPDCLSSFHKLDFNPRGPRGPRQQLYPIKKLFNCQSTQKSYLLSNFPFLKKYFIYKNNLNLSQTGANLPWISCSLTVRTIN